MFQSAGLNSFYIDGEFINVDVIELEVSRKYFKLGHKRGAAIAKLKMAAQLIYLYSGMDEELAKAGYNRESIFKWVQEARQ